MRRLLVCAIVLAACRKDAPPDAAPAVRIPDAAVAVVPVDAHPPERVMATDGGADTTTAASMMKVETDTPATPPSSDAITIAAPLPRGDAKDAPVTVAIGDDPAVLVKKILDGVTIPTDRRVVIKINLNGFDRMKPGKKDNGVDGRITDPAFARALIEGLRDKGAKEIALADGGATTPAQLVKVLALSGYQKILDDEHVKFLDLDHDLPKRALALPWAKYLKDQLVVSHWLIDDKPYVIDVAKMKTHRFAVMTLSIKNLMGAIMIGGGATPEKRRWKMHAELAPWLADWQKSRKDDRDVYVAALKTFSERLADAYGALAPDLAIVEGMPPEQGDGFGKIVPFGAHGIAIASRNGCYADYVAAQYYGLADSDALEKEIGVRMPPAIAAVATRYFGGVAGLRKIEVTGDVAWRKQKRTAAWFKAMAPFELNPL